MLYTLGYTGTKIETIEAFLEAHKAMLCDIRYMPSSRNPIYTKKHLQARLGARYIHLASLGNRNYRGGPITLVDYSQGKQEVEALLRQQAVVLLCVCPEVTDCHRKGVSEQLSADLGVGLEHLTLRTTTPQHRQQPSLF